MAGDQIAGGIVGGSSFYELLDDAREVEVMYGASSAPVVVGDIGGRTVGFLPRHGRGHAAAPPDQPPARHDGRRPRAIR